MTTEMKDGLGNEFTLQTKDISAGQNNSFRQNWHLATRYPVDHTGGGSYQVGMRSGSMAAGLAANSPIASFRFASVTNAALIRRIKLSAWTLGTGFAAGLALFDLYFARGFTVADSGGLTASLTGNSGKLSTLNMLASQASLMVSNTAALTVGTRALDAAALDTLMAQAATGANSAFVTNTNLFLESDHPLRLDNQEGFVVNATVPATGLWQFALSVAWDEVVETSY